MLQVRYNFLPSYFSNRFSVSTNTAQSDSNPVNLVAEIRFRFPIIQTLKERRVSCEQLSCPKLLHRRARKFLLLSVGNRENTLSYLHSTLVFFYSRLGSCRVNQCHSLSYCHSKSLNKLSRIVFKIASRNAGNPISKKNAKLPI